jgi:hypothetical protein
VILGRVLIPCAFALAACAQGSPLPGDAGTATVPSDSLRGRVEVVGSEPATQVALIMNEGVRAVMLEGDRPSLDRLQGLDVLVRGAFEPRTGQIGGRAFVVREFAVRAADGVPAVDGILARRGGGFALVMGDGRRLDVAHLPESLRNHVGDRVWIAGPLDRPAISFGVIGPGSRH